MSRRKLVLFCLAFPSSKGESFLQTEIPYLLNEFDHLSVFSEYDYSIEDRKKFQNINIFKINRTQKRSLSLGELVILIKEILSQKVFSISKLKLLLATFYYGVNIRDQIKKEIQEGRLDKDSIFYTYWIGESTVGLALLKREYKDLKIISRVHGWDLYIERHSPAYLPLRNFIFEKLNNIYSISQKGKDYLESKYNHKGIIEMSRLGVEKVIEIKEVPSKTREVFRIVSCSSLIDIKRIDLIAKAIFLINEVDIEWVHFGDGPLKGDIERIIEKNKDKKNNVQVNLKGFTSNEEIMRFYQNTFVDLFVNVSTTEGIPVSVMEAMSAGIPVIATDVGGTKELVFHKENGFLINKEISHIDLMEKITDFMELNLETKKRFRQKSREVFEKQYEASSNYLKFIEGLKEL